MTRRCSSRGQQRALSVVLLLLTMLLSAVSQNLQAQDDFDADNNTTVPATTAPAEGSDDGGGTTVGMVCFGGNRDRGLIVTVTSCFSFSFSFCSDIRTHTHTRVTPPPPSTSFHPLLAGAYLLRDIRPGDCRRHLRHQGRAEDGLLHSEDEDGEAQGGIPGWHCQVKAYLRCPARTRAYTHPRAKKKKGEKTPHLPSPPPHLVGS